MLLRRRRVIRCVLGTIVLLSPSVAASQRATEGTPPIPAFEKTDTMIAMRDGVRLHTNYFVPKGFAGNLPIIMIRTPYGIEGGERSFAGAYAELARDGYIFVHQDIRGRFKSEGQFVMLRKMRDKKDPKAVAAYLVTKERYKDFTIRAEFWVSNDANSGIFIRCEDPKKPGAKTCYECNIYDTRPDPSYGTGAIVYHAEVNPMPKAGGKWSTMEIAAKGRDLSIMFDGKQTSSVRSGVHTEGPIALQFGEGVVKFRKVAIKPL